MSRILFMLITGLTLTFSTFSNGLAFDEDAVDAPSARFIEASRDQESIAIIREDGLSVEILNSADSTRRFCVTRERPARSLRYSSGGELLLIADETHLTAIAADTGTERWSVAANPLKGMSYAFASDSGNLVYCDREARELIVQNVSSGHVSARLKMPPEDSKALLHQFRRSADVILLPDRSTLLLIYKPTAGSNGPGNKTSFQLLKLADLKVIHSQTRDLFPVAAFCIPKTDEILFGGIRGVFRGTCSAESIEIPDAVEHSVGQSRFRVFAGRVMDMDISSDQNRIAFISEDGRIVNSVGLNVPYGASLQVIDPHSGQITGRKKISETKQYGRGPGKIRFVDANRKLAFINDADKLTVIPIPAEGKSP